MTTETVSVPCDDLKKVLHYVGIMSLGRNRESGGLRAARRLQQVLDQHQSKVECTCDPCGMMGNSDCKACNPQPAAPADSRKPLTEHDQQIVDDIFSIMLSRNGEFWSRALASGVYRLLKNAYAVAGTEPGTSIQIQQPAAPDLSAPVVGMRDGEYVDCCPNLHVGSSAFEDWYQAHPKACTGDKQLARDAYAAGMGDPVAASFYRADATAAAPVGDVPEGHALVELGFVPEECVRVGGKAIEIAMSVGVTDPQTLAVAAFTDMVLAAHKMAQPTTALEAASPVRDDMHHRDQLLIAVNRLLCNPSDENRLFARDARNAAMESMGLPVSGPEIPTTASAPDLSAPVAASFYRADATTTATGVQP